jgi:hypothetical protein
MWGQFEFVLPSATLVWSTSLGLSKQCGRQMHQHSTSGIRRRGIRIRRWHSTVLTHGAMWGCELTSLVVCINDNFCDIRKSEIWTMKIHSLRFQEFIECVTLWGLILWSLGCISSISGICKRNWFYTKENVRLWFFVICLEPTSLLVSGSFVVHCAGIGVLRCTLVSSSDNLWRFVNVWFCALVNSKILKHYEEYQTSMFLINMTLTFD